MSKPILDIEVSTPDEKTASVRAVFDSGSFYTIVREDKVPSPAAVIVRRTPRQLRIGTVRPVVPAAAMGSQLRATGDVSLVLTIGDRQIDDIALVSPDLAQEMIVGAGTMQKWDISIINRNGHTEVSVGRDMRDPDIIEVD